MKMEMNLQGMVSTPFKLPTLPVSLSGTVVYDIRAVLPDASGRVFTDLVCEQGGNQG